MYHVSKCSGVILGPEHFDTFFFWIDFRRIHLHKAMCEEDRSSYGLLTYIISDIEKEYIQVKNNIATNNNIGLAWLTF